MQRILTPLFLFAGIAAQAVPRPNIIVILADDMGISDIGCYGSEIHTQTWTGWPRTDCVSASSTTARAVAPPG